MSWMSSSRKSEISTQKLWATEATITDLHANNIVVQTSIVLQNDSDNDEEVIDHNTWRNMKEELSQVKDELANLQAKYDRMEQEFQAIKDQLASRKTVQADFDAITESIVPPTN